MLDKYKEKCKYLFYLCKITAIGSTNGAYILARNNNFSRCTCWRSYLIFTVKEDKSDQCHNHFFEIISLFSFSFWGYVTGAPLQIYSWPKAFLHLSLRWALLGSKVLRNIPKGKKQTSFLIKHMSFSLPCHRSLSKICGCHCIRHVSWSFNVCIWCLHRKMDLILSNSSTTAPKSEWNTMWMLTA